MSECNHDCGACAHKCDQAAPESFLAPANPHSRVKRVIAVVSGKGGVGKSLVTGLMAAGMSRRGHTAAVLDADITGPSMPRLFGLHGRCEGCDDGIYPLESARGVKLMSIGCLLDNETDPVIWRGSLISGTVKQFWTDVIWGEVDYMFVDMPPGTGDVPLTVFQSLPVDGVLIVASPQELVSVIVEKAVNMANVMNIPVLGLIENMAWMSCPGCGEKLYPFGKGKTEQVAAAHDLPLLARLPIDPAIARACDEGRVEDVRGDWLDTAMEICEAIGG